MKYQKTHKKTSIIIISSILLVITIGYFVFAYTSKSVWPFTSSTTTTTQDSNNTNDINYSPLTEQEQENSQNGKKNSEEKTEEKDLVNVDISYTGLSDDDSSLEIRAFTTDVIEGSGTCTATLTRNSLKVTASSKGFVDARSTICEPIEIPLSEFDESGVWKITVTYTSPTKSGVSPVSEVDV